MVLNALVRAVYEAPRSSSAIELLRSLHCLRKFKLTAITYKTELSTGIPVYMATRINSNTPSPALRSSEKLLLSKPILTLSFVQKAFAVSAPSIWNTLSFD